MMEPLLFRNLVLEIGEEVGDSYRVSLVESPWGRAETMVSAEVLAELRDLNNRLETAYEKDTPRGVKALSKHIGARLFDTLVPGDIRRRYDKSFGVAYQEGAVLRILLRVTPGEWSDLLLELMYDSDMPYAGDRFLSRGTKTVLSRYPFTVVPDNDPTQLKKFKILVVIASPRDMPPLDTKSEMEKLRRAVKQRAELPMRILRLSPSVKVEYLKQATYASLEARMQSFRPHAVHFVGHAVYTDQKPGLVLEDEKGLSDIVFDEDRLSRLFRGPEQSPLLVCLNACKTFDIGQQLISYYHIPTVIGTKYQVHDQVAIKFTAELYKRLLGGYPIDYVVREAREGILGLKDYEYEWMVYLLAMRSKTGQLLESALDPELARLVDEIWAHIKNLASTVKEVYDAAFKALVEFGEAVVGFLVMVVETVQLPLSQREGAVKVLGEVMAQTGDILPVEPLADVVQNRDEPMSIREEAIRALGQSDAEDSRKTLVELWLDKTVDVPLREWVYEEVDEQTKELITEVRQIEDDTDGLNQRVAQLASQVAPLSHQAEEILENFQQSQDIDRAWSEEVSQLVDFADRLFVRDMTVAQLDAIRINCNQLAQQGREVSQQLGTMIGSFLKRLAQSNVSVTRLELLEQQQNLQRGLEDAVSRSEELGLEKNLDSSFEKVRSNLDATERQLDECEVQNPLEYIAAAVPERQERNERDQANLNRLDGAKIIAKDETLRLSVGRPDDIDLH
jgi:hypothetical protein